MLIKLASRVSTFVHGPKLSIFIFHRVLPSADPLLEGEPTRGEFDAIISWIKRDFTILPLGEAWRRFNADSTIGPLAAITFDDGYADNFHVALPVLRRHGVSATFFIASGFLNGGRMWNDTLIESVRRAHGDQLNLTGIGLGRHSLVSYQERRRCVDALIARCKYLPQKEREDKVAAVAATVDEPLPDDLMMSTSELRTLCEAGMELGAHTQTHPILAAISAADAAREIGDGRDELQSVAGKPIQLFAYPNGKPRQDYLPEHVSIVAAMGFDAAVCTAWGAASKKTDRFQLPRFTPWDRKRWKFRVRAIQNRWREAEFLETS